MVSTHALERFCLIGNSTKGSACIALIQQVLSHPEIFNFGELLMNTNIITQVKQTLFN